MLIIVFDKCCVTLIVNEVFRSSQEVAMCNIGDAENTLKPTKTDQEESLYRKRVYIVSDGHNTSILVH